MRSRLEAIQKIKCPTTIKGCRSFAGMVKFLCLSCPELQMLLKPVFDTTGKGRQFIWGEQKKTLEELKRRLQEPLVLHFPGNKGRFHIYSHTSKYATGIDLYQIRNGKPN